MEPLMLQWKDYAAVNGDRIGGRLEVSNSTGDDFDFTVVVLAVNEIGKAFAIGYQHFPLKSGAESLEIPFGETLPQGKYVVHDRGRRGSRSACLVIRLLPILPDAR